MGQHVGIRMAQQALFVGNVHAAQNKLATLGKGVHVLALSDAQCGNVHLYPLMARTARVRER